MSQLCYVDSNTNVTVNTKPVVHHPTFVRFRKDGRVVGTIKATFDFSDVPPNLHLWGLQFIQSVNTSIYLAHDDPPEQAEPPKPAESSWWKRWFG